LHRNVVLVVVFHTTVAHLRLPVPKLAAVTVLALSAAGAARAQDGDQPQVPVRTQVDIEIAIDTTGSMGPSIDQAKRDADELR
jgi:hypothetical protein